MLLKLNSRGSDVATLQELLNLKSDGIFGKQTENAVKEFQNANNLKADGIVGTKTWDALNSLDTDNSIQVNGLYEKYHLSNGEYSKNKTNKEYVFIHHTAGWHNPYNTIKRWDSDNRGMIATEFVIGGQNIRNDDNSFDGKILQAFPSGHYAWHLGKNGNQNMHTNSVGIELNNFGYIQQNKTYAGQYVHERQRVTLKDEFRGYKVWHKYSNFQIQSLEKLLKFIAERDSIDIRKGLPSLIKEKGAKAFEFNEDAFYGRIKGLWTHTNTRKDKFDCFPQEELMDMLVSL
ncbi:peptidoglycan-binding protein [Candidatus Woesearchaeota archaeon]|nr:peptidoglycan-binding protein [Candidatus Woesearchaeota archaeon]